VCQVLHVLVVSHCDVNCLEFLSLLTYPNSRGGMIYFIQDERGPIKIGYTRSAPYKRLKSLQTSNPNKLTLLGVMEGGLKDEEELHYKFNSIRLFGEWFKPSYKLKQFIKVKTNYNVVNGDLVEQDPLEIEIANSVKTLRLQRNLDRQTLCEKAGISENALRNLEGGKGATLKTLVKTLRVLDKVDWLLALAPIISVNPLHMVNGKPRQRSRRRV